jgi:hypothetical protein
LVVQFSPDLAVTAAATAATATAKITGCRLFGGVIQPVAVSVSNRVPVPVRTLISVPAACHKWQALPRTTAQP